MDTPKLWLFVVALGVSTGCGPFTYMKEVTQNAEPALLVAEAVGGAEFAPYEYWGAVAYLEQAKILMAYSEYERSLDFARRAHELANEAVLKASRNLGSFTPKQVDDPCAELEGPASKATILAREILCEAESSEELPPE
jgi:hypothetical protein